MLHELDLKVHFGFFRKTLFGDLGFNSRLLMLVVMNQLIPVLVVAMFRSEGVSGYESADYCVGCCNVWQ